MSSYGGIHQFRADGAVTAAQYQQSMNDGRAISICLDGNFDEELPTDAQRKTTAALIQEKAKFYNIPLKNIRCHRSVATYKSCPGILLPDDIYTYFLTAKPMDKPKPSVTEWAKEAWAWGLKEGFIHEDSEPTLEFQRALVLDYRIHKKYAK